MLRRALALLGLLAVVLAAADARAERRVALVIGNATYEHASALRNPINDARDIAATLKNLGFEVMVGTDLDQRAFASMIDQFGRMLEGADVALFFYAGHGLQVNDKNYLVSTRAKTQAEAMQMAMSVLLPSVLLSGYIFPLPSLPAPLRLISAVLPATHYIAISRGVIVRAAALADLWGHVVALLANATVLVLASTQAFKKTLS